MQGAGCPGSARQRQAAEVVEDGPEDEAATDDDNAGHGAEAQKLAAAVIRCRSARRGHQVVCLNEQKAYVAAATVSDAA